MHEIDRDPFTPEASSSTCTHNNEHPIMKLYMSTGHTNTMNISLYIGPSIPIEPPPPIIHQRQIIIYHHIHLQDIDPARDNVSGDEHLFATLTEIVDYGITLCSVFGTMQGGYFVPFCDHAFGNCVCCVTVLPTTQPISYIQLIL